MPSRRIARVERRVSRDVDECAVATQMHALPIVHDIRSPTTATVITKANFYFQSRKVTLMRAAASPSVASNDRVASALSNFKKRDENVVILLIKIEFTLSI